MNRPVGQLIALLWGQQLGLLCLVTGCLWWLDAIMAYSVFLGGMIFWIPNAYFALLAFRYRGAPAVRLMLSSFYRGLYGKFLLTGVGFALAFVLVEPLSYAALFAAFGGMTLSQWWLVSRWRWSPDGN